MSSRSVATIVMAALTAGGKSSSWAQEVPAKASREKAVMAAQTKLYCNINALNPAERMHHKQLTEKLVAARKQTVETEKGYEFEYSPSNVSLAELCEWVAAESKCCPFFDFHIDLEREGRSLRLRLTGGDGIKPFILAEFHVPPK